MRTDLVAAAGVLLTGIGLSLLLIPRGEELALMRYRDADYAEALPTYEAAYAAGDHSAATAMPLVKLLLLQGKDDRAIAIVEDFLAAEPKQVEALRLLGSLYYGAQRIEDYLDVLETLNTVAPTEDIDRELATYHGFHGEFAKQTEDLRRLVRRHPDDVDVAETLASLLAAVHEYDEAIVVLGKLDDLKDGAIDEQLLLNLLVDQSRFDEAKTRSRRWLAGDPPTYRVIGVENAFASAGRLDDALDLMRPFADRAATDDALNLALIDLLSSTGRFDESRERLSAWAKRGRIESASLGRFVGAALTAGMPELALSSIENRPLTLLLEWTLVGLAESAWQRQNRAVLDRIVGELGDSFLDERPLLAANIARVRGDADGVARWVRHILDSPATPLADRLTALRILNSAGRRNEAAAALDRLDRNGDLPEDALDELAGLFADLGRVPAGLAWFEKRRRSHPSTATEQGWARLAVRAGKTDALTVWLDANPNVPADLLQDIAYAAVSRGDAALALKAAQRVYASMPTPASAQALAEALIAAKRPAEAVPLLKPLLARGGPAVEAAYIAALSELGRTNELAEYWTGKLAAGSQTDAERKTMLYALLDLKAYGAALPYIKDYARRDGGEWLYGYADTAKKAGAIPDLIAFFEAEAQRSDLPADQRDLRVSLLVETAGPDAALPALRRLSQAGRQSWEDAYVAALTSLGRFDELTDFLTAKIERPDLTDDARKALVFALLDRKAFSAALPYLRRYAHETGGEWLFGYAEAAQKAGAFPDLIAFLDQETDRAELPLDRRQQCLSLLVDTAGPEAALPTLRRLAKAGNPAWEDAYVAALTELKRDDELNGFLTAKLESPGQSDEARKAVVFALLDRKSYGAALPFLRRFAHDVGGEWLYAYADAAKKAGVLPVLIAFLEAEARRGDLPPDQRDQRVFLLSDAGPDALPALRRLAETGPSSWEDAYVAALTASNRTDELVSFLNAKLDRPNLSAEARKAVIFALLDHKAFTAVLPQLKRLAHDAGGEWLFAYADAAKKAGGLPDFLAFLEGETARADLAPADREQRAGLLLDAAGPKRALPTILRMAESVGGSWEALYRETLVKLGRRDELRRHLAVYAADPKRPAEERRQTAAALLELGDRPAAERAFLQLASAEAPDGADVAQLLYLWGPRAPAPALDWLAKRAATAATASDKEKWYEILTAHGGAARVAAAGAAVPPSSRIEALAAGGDRRALAEAIGKAVPAETDANRLIRFAKLAEQAGTVDAAAVAWQAVLKIRPNDLDALRQLGVHAFDRNDHEAAERYLVRYLAQTPGEFEINHMAGDALSALKRPGEAAVYWSRALDRLRKGPKLDAARRLTEAILLGRLGRVDEAILAFENLRRDNPQNLQIKADYATMLLEQGRAREARNVLESN